MKLKEVLVLLEENYETRGLRLQRNNGRIQLTTAPEMAKYIEYYLGLESSTRLSRAKPWKPLRLLPINNP